MVTPVIMSTGLGLPADLSDFAPGGNTFESYQFESISSVTRTDLRNITPVFIPVVSVSIVYYAAFLDIAVDPSLARMAGVKVKLINGLFTLLTAVTVALSRKIVGALLVTSLLVLPVAMALLISRSYRGPFILSILLGVVYMMLGIIISYHYDPRPKGAIVMNAVIGMLLMRGYSRIRKVYKEQS